MPSQTMGMDFGLDTCPARKRKFRWLFAIPEVCGTRNNSAGVSALPPMKSARPNIQFKEMEARHINETIYYPAKPEWKPITITMYDLSNGNHPVIRWFDEIYNAKEGKWKPSAKEGFMKQATLELLSGCGDTIEKWVFEDAWPQTIEFGDLDMGSNEVVLCEINLRFSRAYVEETPSFERTPESDEISSFPRTSLF